MSSGSHKTIKFVIHFSDFSVLFLLEFENYLGAVFLNFTFPKIGYKWLILLNNARNKISLTDPNRCESHWVEILSIYAFLFFTLLFHENKNSKLTNNMNIKFWYSAKASKFWKKPHNYFDSTKGQLISKGLVGILNSSKKLKKKFNLQYLWYLGSTCFHLFFWKNWRHQKVLWKLTDL